MIGRRNGLRRTKSSELGFEVWRVKKSGVNDGVRALFKTRMTIGEIGGLNG